MPENLKKNILSKGGTGTKGIAAANKGRLKKKGNASMS